MRCCFQKKQPVLKKNYEIYKKKAFFYLVWNNLTCKLFILMYISVLFIF